MIYYNNSTKLLYRGKLKLLYTRTLENQQRIQPSQQIASYITVTGKNQHNILHNPKLTTMFVNAESKYMHICEKTETKHT